MPKKTCISCLNTFPLSRFYKHPSAKFGRQNRCKECHKADAKKHRQNRIEHWLEYDRGRAFDPDRVKARKAYQKARMKDPKFRKRIAETKRNWADRNPEKRKAQTALGNAVRDGRIKKPKACQECGGTKWRIQGHHDDYSKPLDVRWVCAPCHGKIHRRFEGK